MNKTSRVILIGFLILLLSSSVIALEDIPTVEETEEEIIFSLESDHWVIKSPAEAKITEDENKGQVLEVNNVEAWGDNIFFYFGDKNNQVDLRDYEAIKFDVKTNGHMVQIGMQGFKGLDDDGELDRSWGDYDVNVTENMWSEVAITMDNLLEAQQDYEDLQSLENIINIVIKGAGDNYSIANFRLMK